MSRILSAILKGLILFYRGVISPLFPPKCRYVPTCSEYGLQAITKYGPFRGLWMTLKRLVKCHPWGGHGHDPVP